MMLRFFILLSFLASSIAVIASPQAISYKKVTTRFNPLYNHHGRSAPGADLSQVEANRLTNARRLALQLPLKAPIRRKLARRSEYNTTYNATGYLGVLEKNKFLGCISNAYNKFGEYGILTDTSPQCLLVSLDLSETNPQASSISTVNAPLAAYPFFGAISGYGNEGSDLGAGLANYAVFGGTSRRPANSRPMEGGNSFTHRTGIPRAFENAIFSYSPGARKINFHWVNADGSEPAVHLGHNSMGDALFITGDKVSFTKAYGSKSTRWVTLHLMPQH